MHCDLTFGHLYWQSRLFKLNVSLSEVRLLDPSITFWMLVRLLTILHVVVIGLDTLCRIWTRHTTQTCRWCWWIRSTLTRTRTRSFASTRTWTLRYTRSTSRGEISGVGMCGNRISVRFRFIKTRTEPKPKGQTRNFGFRGFSQNRTCLYTNSQYLSHSHKALTFFTLRTLSDSKWS